MAQLQPQREQGYSRGKKEDLMDKRVRVMMHSFQAMKEDLTDMRVRVTMHSFQAMMFRAQQGTAGHSRAQGGVDSLHEPMGAMMVCWRANGLRSQQSDWSFARAHEVAHYHEH